MEKTSKVRTSALTHHYNHNEPPKMLVSFFSVGHLLLGVKPTLKDSLFPQLDSLGETNSFHLPVVINWR